MAHVLRVNGRYGLRVVRFSIPDHRIDFTYVRPGCSFQKECCGVDFNEEKVALTVFPQAIRLQHAGRRDRSGEVCCLWQWQRSPYVSRERLRGPHLVPGARGQHHQATQVSPDPL